MLQQTPFSQGMFCSLIYMLCRNGQNISRDIDKIRSIFKLVLLRGDVPLAFKVFFVLFYDWCEFR